VHDTTTSWNYNLAHDQLTLPNTQMNWRWCAKCQGLFWAGGQSNGICQAGGPHADVASGYNYALSIDVSVTGAQSQWRWCRKCMELVFEGNADCAAGGVHFNNGSGEYTLTFSDGRVKGQDNWKWCSQCYSLIYAGGQSLGVCPNTGGAHQVSDSGNYILTLDGNSQMGLQGQWSWCSQCQMLWWTGNGPKRCPQGPSIYHTNVGSYQYFLGFQQSSSIETVSTATSTATSTAIIGATSTATSAVYGRNGLSGGKIAGIIIGVLIFCSAFLCLLLLYCRRAKKDRGLPEVQALATEYGNGLNMEREEPQKTLILEGTNQVTEDTRRNERTVVADQIQELDGRPMHEVP